MRRKEARRLSAGRSCNKSFSGRKWGLELAALALSLSLNLSEGAIAQGLLPASAAAPFTATSAHAADSQSLDSMDSIPLVYQLAHIQPNDWEYRQLQQLMERHGIDLRDVSAQIEEGRSLSRYEFAAILQASLSRIESTLQANDRRYISQRDFAVRERLTTQFQAELESLNERLSDQAQRAFELEVNRVSPTLRLNGEAVLAIADQYGDNLDSQATFQHRLRLDLTSQFTGRDLLLMRLSAGKTPGLGQAASDDLERTAEGTLAAAIRGDTDEAIALDTLSYTFSMGDRLSIWVSAAGGLHSHYVQTTFSPYFEDFTGGNGSISAFGQASPIYSIGGGTGIGISSFLTKNDTLSLSAGYVAESATSSLNGAGLFNGDYAVLGQLSAAPSDRLQLGLTYVHGFHTSGNAIFDYGEGNVFYVGTAPANVTHTALDTAATTHSYGAQAAYQVNHRLTLHAFGGYTHLQIHNRASGDIWYYGLGAAFPDLVLPNSLAGITVGAEPYLGGLGEANSAALRRITNDTSLHVEVFYRLQLSDFISLTPGMIWITAPNQSSDRPDRFVSTFRTTFQF